MIRWCAILVGHFWEHVHIKDEKSLSCKITASLPGN